MNRIILGFVIWQLTLIGLLVNSHQEVFLLNFELSFAVATLIIFASYQGYRTMINNAVHNDIHMETKDILESIEDPYDLYDESPETKEPEADEKVKKEGFKKMMKAKAGHGSWKRMLAYVTLVLTFLALRNNELLNIAGFLSGLTLGMIFAGLMGTKLIKS